MSCPIGVNTGFIGISGPISQTDIDKITVDSHPLTLALGPKRTTPQIFDNRIDESGNNTCIYDGNTYTLEYVKICSVMNTGYTIPGITEQPGAELIVSFTISSNKNATNKHKILLCVPIYNSTYLSHDKYITQILDNSTCKPSSLEENTTYYKDNTPYTAKKANSLSKCYLQACNSPTTLAYTYYPNTDKIGPQKGNCLLFNSIPITTKTNVLTTDENYSISGTVNHNESYNTQNKFFTLESVFYSDKDEEIQTSFAYTTCFGFEEYEPITAYVIVFPNGIHLTSNIFQHLKIKLNGKFIPYGVSGVEFKKTNLISVTDPTFNTSFQYFKLPPNTKTKEFNTEKCPYYQTSQYKCVPFNQLTDLSNNYVVPGNKTLEDILEKEEEEEEPISTDDVMVYAIVGVVAIVFITGLYFALKD